MIQDILVFLIISGTVLINVFYFAKSLKVGDANSASPKNKCGGCTGCDLSKAIESNNQ